MCLDSDAKRLGEDESGPEPSGQLERFLQAGPAFTVQGGGGGKARQSDAGGEVGAAVGVHSQVALPGTQAPQGSGDGRGDIGGVDWSKQGEASPIAAAYHAQAGMGL
jgi:hypothetical protein